ncbi:alkane 1-monooxygenase [Phaeocystidibacter luteus]|uniref:Alkane 1-monooxygenase n=1 Tax=Phaeocystidibacter luteus TaxID=911197 RepID=A0A6N6RFR0_9FLAO|nr:alkane 1-monooxygenase [Phaeocystidibacter luteus]KAB2809909.1 alkane 1-monooxygenase [Phaeocystidibacter luteus]
MRVPLRDKLKYLSVYTLPLAAAVSFTSEGWITFLPIAYAFMVIPLVELFIPADKSNDSPEIAEAKANDRWFDFLVELIVPVHYAFGIWFLISVSGTGNDWVTIAGRISSYGLMCGVIGINVAHELGHRPNKFHQFLAKSLLLTSLYTHFFIEHNRGHHKHVATPEDPSTARLNEPLMFFWVRSVSQTYRKAWSLEAQRLRRKKSSVISLQNEMIRFTIAHLVMLGAIYFFFGWAVMLYYTAAAIIGFLLLETVNYIEHYGLLREKVSEHRYENASPLHSWNSDHQYGRAFLFELSRHSDHHFKPAKKYPTLDRWEEAPQMPTGYPGMMLLSLFPPLWFAVMNKKVIEFRLKKVEAEARE